MSERVGDDSGELHLTHVSSAGSAQMVDIADKSETDRLAVAEGVVTMASSTVDLIVNGEIEKGEVFATARLAGITGAKKTAELIPLCHQVPLTHISVDFRTDLKLGKVIITASARAFAKTGVEMEALTAVGVAALTIYDMCKAVDKGIRIGDIRLLEKHGGRGGSYRA